MAGETGLTSTAQIKVAGEVDTEALDYLTELRVSHDVGATSHARIRFDVSKWEGAPRFVVGKSLDVAVVDAGSKSTTIFVGDIVAVGIDITEQRRELIVDAYDKSYKLARLTISESTKEQTVEKIVKDIALEAGLKADVSANAAKLRPLNDSTLQLFGTARKFLTSFCRSAGCEWLVDDAKLIVRERKTTETSATVSAGIDLIQFTGRFSSFDQAKKISVRGWNPQKKEAFVGNATAVNNAAPSTTKIVKDNSRGSEVTTWPRPLISQEDANAAAKGVAETMGATVLNATGVVEVDPSIVTNSLVKVEGVGDDFNGSYYITGVEHIFGDGRTFVTRFTAGSLEPTSLVDLLGRGADSNTDRFAGGLTIGIVTNNKDVDPAQARVKVKLPYLSDGNESEWARLSQPGAGAERGLLMLPEIDDEVLVGFEHGDIRRPIVLGGLWNGKDKPPLASTDTGLLKGGEVTSRTLTSRNGHRLTLADKGDDGNYVELLLGGGEAQLWLGDEKIDIVQSGDHPITIKNKKASITIADTGDITLEGENIKISAKKDITLKAQNISATSDLETKLEAKVNFSAEGATGMKIESTKGITEVKGSMVKIN